MEVKQNNEKEKNSKIDNINEKKVIIGLIALALILIYVSFFFIHNIIDRSQIKDVISGVINFPDKNTTNTVEDNTTEDLIPPEIVDNSDRFKVKQGDKTFNEEKELHMFKNVYFDDHAIIAPGVHGSYSFTVENDSESKFDYEVMFTETNIYEINMVYKIKVNGEYVIGNENEWVTHDDFKIPSKRISSYKTDIFTVEWKWEDADNDTQIGETDGANYKMNVSVDAKQVIE